MMTLEETSNWKHDSILQGHGPSPEISYQSGKQFHYQEREGLQEALSQLPEALPSVAKARDAHKKTAIYCAARGNSQLGTGTLSRKW